MKSLLLPGLVLALGGCATQNYATFVTKTSISVIDADSAPAEVSIAFSRTEGYKGPRFDDGTVYPVAGFLETRGAALTRATQQVFAGGRAAEIVTGAPPSGGRANCGDKLDMPPLFLATGTSLGIRIGLTDGGLPSSFNFGYRRKEATLVPVSKDCMPSVLATHDSDAKPDESVKGKEGLALTQYFATGTAADALANRDNVKALFRQKAEAAVTAVAASKARNGEQSVLALKAINCAGHVKDASFDRVVSHAGELGLFPTPTTAAAVLAKTPMAERRRSYAAELSLALGDRDDRTAQLQKHADRVCGMADAS